MRIRTLLTIATLVACKGGEPTDSGDGLLWPPSKPFQTTGDEGSVVLVALDWPENPRIDVYGMFADDLQGYATGAACAQDALPCVREIPEELDSQVRANNRAFIPSLSKTRWVGDQVNVGPVFADLVHRTDERIAFYRGTEDQGPVGSFRIRFGGEWANYDRPAVSFANNFRVVEPLLDVGERLDLSGSPIEFRWISNLENEVWLWVQGSETRQFFHLQDDGYFELRPNELGLEPAEVVEVGLAAVTREQVDVDGNQLEVLALNGNGWKGSECGGFLEVDVENTPPTTDPMVHPRYYGFQFKGIIDDGLRDYIDPDTGERESAKLLFTFYDEFLQPQCEIEYDASNGGRTMPFLTDSGANIYASYRVALFNGRSTCGLVDPTITGFSDLRNWLEQFDWGFGLGEVTELEEVLSNAFGQEAWSTQKDFVYGVFWTQDGLFGDEQGYGYGSRLRQCDTGSNGVEPLPDDGELDVGYYFTFPFYIQPILQ